MRQNVLSIPWHVRTYHSSMYHTQGTGQTNKTENFEKKKRYTKHEVNGSKEGNRSLLTILMKKFCQYPGTCGHTTDQYTTLKALVKHAKKK